MDMHKKLSNIHSQRKIDTKEQLVYVQYYSPEKKNRTSQLKMSVVHLYLKEAHFCWKPLTSRAERLDIEDVDYGGKWTPDMSKLFKVNLLFTVKTTSGWSHVDYDDGCAGKHM